MDGIGLLSMGIPLSCVMDSSGASSVLFLFYLFVNFFNLLLLLPEYVLYDCGYKKMVGEEG